MFDQARSLVDQAGVDLHHIGAGPDLAHGVFGTHDAANTDDRELRAQRRTQLADHLVAHDQHGRARQAAGLVGMGQSLDGFAAQRGVGRHHAPGVVDLARAVESVTLQGLGDHLDLVRVEVGCNFQKDRDALAMFLGQQFTPI